MNDEYITPEEIELHKEFLEKVGAEEPKRSCDMVRAWMKINIESSMTKVKNN